MVRWNRKLSYLFVAFRVFQSMHLFTKTKYTKNMQLVNFVTFCEIVKVTREKKTVRKQAIFFNFLI